MNLEGMKQLGRLMGVEEERLDSMVSNLSIGLDKTTKKEDIKLDFTSGNVEDNHRNMIGAFKKALWTFENSDEVECDEHLINDNMLQAMWKNINIYAYDIESFFLDKFVFYLKQGKELIYKMYFSIEDGSIFLFVKNHMGDDVVCGTVVVKDGKFLPAAAVSEGFVLPITQSHIAENLPTDRQFIANRSIMNCLMYIIIVNQMVVQNREVVTETSRRIEIQGKKKPSKKRKSQPKKTKQIRYIRIDGEKVKRIREEHERAERESFERHTSEWSRRGHYKRVRSGEVKWIAPTTCKAKDKVGEKVQKLYRIK